MHGLVNELGHVGDHRLKEMEQVKIQAVVVDALDAVVRIRLTSVLSAYTCQLRSTSLTQRRLIVYLHIALLIRLVLLDLFCNGSKQAITDVFESLDII